VPDEPPITGQLNDASLPALYRDADAASLRAQRQFFAATAAILACSIVAAIFGAVDADWAGYISALAFVGALAGSYVVLKSNPERVWYDGRAVAESVKTLAWQYAVGGGDFPRSLASPESAEERATDRRFIAALVEVRRGLGDVTPVPQGPIQQLSTTMRNIRASNLESRRAEYLLGRIENQADWYADKSQMNAKQRVVWGVMSAALQTVGLLGAIGKAAGIIHFDLLGIAAAAALAAAGWLRAKDHAELARAYAIAASELGDARVELEAARSEQEWAIAVHDAESAISREHTRWAARRHLRPPQ
jgi:SMODS and SLOG-associating 2TM effector domain 3/SMODS and SLOG-associating 2TM effector domain 1